METTNTRALTRKLATIMGILGPLPRTGEKKGTARSGNEFSFDVFLEGDILQPVQRELAKHGVIIVPKCMAIDRRDKLVDVMVEYAIYDADSDQTLVGQMPGSAAESGDGTAVSKALTDSNKNFLRKLFELTAADDPGKAPRAQQSRPAAPQPTAPSADANGKAVISEPQRKRLWALCKEHGVEADKLKDWLFKERGFASSRDITKAAYEGVCGWVQGGGK